MDWQRVIEQALPRRRTDEPTGLRRDIVDEVLDHLHCAAEHEQRRGAAPDQAWRRAVDALGDPVKLARKLWFQAMKENIMRDRLLLLGIGLMVIVGTASTVLSYQAVQSMRATNTAILDRLAEKPEAPAARDGALADWSKVTFRVLQQGDSQQPDAGVTVRIHGHVFTTGDAITLREVTDANGCATFGPIQPGRYLYRLDRKGFFLGALTSITYSFNVFAGQDLVMDVPSPPLSDASSLVADLVVPEGHILSVQLKAYDVEGLSTEFRGHAWRFGDNKLHLCQDDQGRLYEGVCKLGSSNIQIDGREVKADRIGLGKPLEVASVDAAPGRWYVVRARIWKRIADDTEQTTGKSPAENEDCTPVPGLWREADINQGNPSYGARLAEKWFFDREYRELEIDPPSIRVPIGEETKWTVRIPDEWMNIVFPTSETTEAE